MMEKNGPLNLWPKKNHPHLTTIGELQISTRGIQLLQHKKLESSMGLAWMESTVTVFRHGVTSWIFNSFDITCYLSTCKCKNVWLPVFTCFYWSLQVGSHISYLKYSFFSNWDSNTVNSILNRPKMTIPKYFQVLEGWLFMTEMILA